MITVIVKYEGSPRDNREQVGKVLSAINSSKFKKLVREGVVKTRVTNKDGV